MVEPQSFYGERTLDRHSVSGLSTRSPYRISPAAPPLSDRRQSDVRRQSASFESRPLVARTPPGVPQSQLRDASSRRRSLSRNSISLERDAELEEEQVTPRGIKRTPYEPILEEQYQPEDLEPEYVSPHIHGKRYAKDIRPDEIYEQVVRSPLRPLPQETMFRSERPPARFIEDHYGEAAEDAELEIDIRERALQEREMQSGRRYVSEYPDEHERVYLPASSKSVSRSKRYDEEGERRSRYIDEGEYNDEGKRRGRYVDEEGERRGRYVDEEGERRGRYVDEEGERRGRYVDEEERLPRGEVSRRVDHPSRKSLHGKGPSVRHLRDEDARPLHRNYTDEPLYASRSDQRNRWIESATNGDRNFTREHVVASNRESPTPQRAEYVEDARDHVDREYGYREEPRVKVVPKQQLRKIVAISEPKKPSNPMKRNALTPAPQDVGGMPSRKRIAVADDDRDIPRSLYTPRKHTPLRSEIRVMDVEHEDDHFSGEDNEAISSPESVASQLNGYNDRSPSGSAHEHSPPARPSISPEQNNHYDVEDGVADENNWDDQRDVSVEMPTVEVEEDVHNARPKKNTKKSKPKQQKEVKAPAKKQTTNRDEVHGSVKYTTKGNDAPAFIHEEVERIPISENGERRSHRTKVAPVQYWKNERVVYGRRESGIHLIKEVLRVPDSDEHQKPKAKAVKKVEQSLAVPPEIEIINYKTKKEEFQSKLY
jgi:hypothetical protein